MNPAVDTVAALERTALAWQRTALAVGAVGLLLVKLAPGRVVAVSAGVLLLAVAFAMALVGAPLGYRRTLASLERAVDEGSSALPHDPWRRLTLLGLTLATTAAALLAGLDALLG